MNRILVALCAMLFSVAANAQMPEPVVASKQLKVISDSQLELVVTLSIESGWHVYATEGPEGPIYTTLNIEGIKGCEPVGKLKADRDPVSHYDKAFMADLKYYENSVTFSQLFNLTGSVYKIEGYLEYGACNDRSCMPPSAVNFSFNGAIAPVKPEPKKMAEPILKTDEPQKTEVPSKAASVKAEEVKTDVMELPVQTADSSSQASASQPLSADLWAPVSYTTPVTADTTSLWLVFWSCFAGGFVALLTPCVWPIIPMTVSFFLKRTTKRAKGIRDSFIYGLSIIVIYLVLGLSITYIAGPSALNALSTNAIFNLIFTAMLIVFGLSFLGAFELALPSSWSNAVDQKAEQTTGMLSIFLMAFTLALVSFSCTGPIIGFLLVQVSTTGNFVAPAIGMFGFALALALPFTLFALFPSWLTKMPKSGSWMVTVKAVLGFIELAFALKFFSVADLAYGWHLLDREVFIAIWVALAIILGLFLLGKVKIAHADTDSEVGTVRLVGAIVSIAFAVYLIPGLWGAPLKAVSAFCPPMNTQDFVVKDITPHAKYTNYELGMAAAEAEGKPVLVDFTGHGCVNCRKMEQAVWSDPRVAKIIDNDFILISLYVDDKTPLPERVTLDDGTILRTVGDKWSQLERVKFNVNAQPFYAPLDAEGRLLAEPYSFDTEVDHFLSFLDKAKAARQVR